MYTQDGIERLIEQKQIEISFTHFPQDGSVKEKWLDINDKEAEEYKIFSKNYFGDRLNLTLGPIIKSHNKEYFHKRPKFRTWDGCSDIRDSNNKVTLFPKEVISVSTIERIKVADNIAAFTIPKLSNADAGLLYIPSYIDPYWDGILQAVIVNLTNHKQELSLGEKISICRFYQLHSGVSSESKDFFPSKSHHFGNNWVKILEDSSNPFPTRKQPIEESNTNRKLNSLRRYWKAATGIGLGGLTLISIVFSLGALYEKVIKLEDTRNKVIEIDKILTETQNKQISISKKIPESGITNIRLERGKSYASKSFTVNRDFDSISTLWVSTSTPEITAVHGKFSKDPSTTEKSIITIEVQAAEAFTENTAEVKWILVD